MNKGSSQQTRKNIALKEDYILIDERSMLDLVQFTLNFAQNLNFYDLQNELISNWNWKSFLLNDSAFIISMIASTDVKSFKINIDELQIQTEQDKEVVLLKQSINNIINLITGWSESLKQSNYKGVLLSEIEKLKSYADNVKEPLKKNELVVEALKEYYEKFYGTIVFIKEKAFRNFEQKIFSDNNHHPHIGLLFAFFKLFKNVQNDINTITKKHLDYYYLKLLQQQKKKLGPGSALIGLQLQQGTRDLFINEGDKCELIFEGNQQITFNATSTTQINRAEISDIRTLFKSDYHPFTNNFDEDDFSINILYQTDILKNRNDNKNSEVILTEDFPATLGEEQLHSGHSTDKIKLSEIGILVSSPALILEKGLQEINLTFKITPMSYNALEPMFNGLLKQEVKQEREKSVGKKIAQDNEKIKNRITSEFFNDAFLIYFTDIEGWKKVDYCTTKINNIENTLTFDILLKEQDNNLIAFDRDIQEGDFDSNWPCIKILLNNDAQYHPYKFLRDIIVEYISIKASVSEVNNLTLSNSAGNLDNSIPFTPFGPTPMIGSYLRIHNPLIMQKNLTDLRFTINWAGLPQSQDGFADHYRAYPYMINNKTFKAVITQNRNFGNSSEKQNFQLFNLFVKKDEISDEISDNIEIEVNLQNFDFKNRLDPSKNNDENADPIFMVLTNPEIAFGHQIFTNIYAEAALKSSRFRRKPIELPNQPYTPIMERLVVGSYSNRAKEIMLRKQDNKGSDIKLVHIYPFGHIQTFPGPVKSQSFLLPQIQHKGNLLIGLANISSGEIVSIGFELVPAVYIHSVINEPIVHWEYLLNNEWEPLAGLLLEDSTEGLTNSGIVKIEIPVALQFDNTRLPKGKFWIRAVYGGKEDLNSKIKNVFTQAVSLTSENSTSGIFQDLTGDKKVEKIIFTDKKGIGKITGPFALEIGDSIENEDSFYSRISEQLRHKNRVVTNWDVERIILDRFKNIEKVRVYGRNSHPKEVVKGSNLQVVLIPKNNLVDGTRKLSNMVDFSTLKEVKKYISQFVSPYVKVEVSNPVYEQLKVKCSVKFNNFQKRGYLRNVLNNELISYLSPDIENPFIEKGFDESVSKTEILNFIESRPYVEFVTQLSVLQLVEVQGRYKIIDTANNKNKIIEELSTISAYAILTSAPRHQIEIIQNETTISPKISGYGDLSIESDFVISDDKGNYN